MRKELERLVKAMSENGIDYYIVPSEDPHGSEYVNERFKAREYVSGFTGSAGTLLVSKEGAYLWTDGRYFLQAEKELAGSGIELMRDGDEGVPSLSEKLKTLVEEACEKGPGNATIGFFGGTMNARTGKKIAETLKGSSAELVTDKDLVGGIWEGRPEIEPGAVHEIPFDVTGKSAEDKLREVRLKMKEKDADVLLVSDLTETAYLLNLRGSDIAHTPVFYSYSLITKDDITLFTMKGALSDHLKEKLRSEITGIIFRDIGEIEEKMSILPGRTCWFDSRKTSYNLAKSIRRDVIDAPTPLELMKAVKNEHEILATINAHLKDAKAVTRFIYWIKKSIGKKKLSELKCCEKLRELRMSEEGCFDLSFPTIAAYKENGAVIHYEPSKETDSALSQEGFLLVDSGGQYNDGTTDITRTIALGPLTEKERENYTMVLKSHIDLAMHVFPEGTTGKELDTMARRPLAKKGMDYAHGTGHGVGHILSVHEGPCYISKNNSDEAFLPGMITSNEPGYYKEGCYGIRLENEMLCEEAIPSGSGENIRTEWPDEAEPRTVYGEKMDEEVKASAVEAGGKKLLCFRTLTTVPFERAAIVPEMLNEKELLWLNEYLQHVRNSLILLLDPEEAEWLMDETMPL